MIKKYFLTGLAVLLPMVITFWIVAFIVNLLTTPFQNFVEEILRYNGLADLSFLFLNNHQILTFISKFLILITLLFGTFVIGLLARVFLAHYLIQLGNYIMYRIPILNTIYKTIQEIAESFLEGNSQAFTQVVLAPFPHQKSWSLGLVANEARHGLKNNEEEMLSVFILAAPNPTLGYLLLLKKSEVIFLDMQVDEAVKAIVSCGIVFAQAKQQ